MKTKIFFTMYLIFHATVGFCQTQWSPSVAEWYFSIDGGNPTNGYKKYVYEKDTIIDAKICQVIHGFNSSDRNSIQREVMYEENGEVYYFFKEKFRKIYDFTLQKGDLASLEFKGYSENSSVIDTTYIVNFKIEDISTVFVDGKEVKKFTASETEFHQDSIHGNTYVYYEKIGNLQEFIPVRFAHNMFTENNDLLRCYNDADIHYVSDEWSLYENKLCDYVSSPIPEPVIDSVKIIPALPSAGDEIKFAVFVSEIFNGNCTYEMKVDRIIDQTIYVEGKIDTGNECGNNQDATVKDTVSIGALFNPGVYQVIYNLSDENGIVSSKRTSFNFEVRIPQSDVHFTIDNKIAFYLKREGKELIIQTGQANNVSVSFHDLAGAQHSVKQTLRESSIVLDLSKVPQGVYIITVRDTKGNSYAEKIVF